MPQIKIVLNDEEKILTSRLKEKIIAHIEKAGSSIPVSKYIELALYDRVDGYYNNLLHKFGKDGDFVTAPIISGLFAQCLAIQIHELWDNSTIMRNILEIGPGNGQLMLDLLSIMGELIDKYYILEVSANLCELQRQRLHKEYPHLLSKVVWLNQLPKEFEGIILANEVLDAQPSEVVMWDRDNIKRRMVSIDQNNNFVYSAERIKSKELLKIAKKLEIESDCYISEINLNNRGFVKTLAETLDAGFIILIDYGYAASEYYAPNRSNGTLRGFFRQHQLDDILIYPGLIDITSSVDFSSVATTAIDNHLDFVGYTSQASFLLNCDLVKIVADAHRVLNNIDYLKLTKQVNYLTAPDEMGEVFKVIGFSKNIAFSEWLGFSSNDRSYTL